MAKFGVLFVVALSLTASLQTVVSDRNFTSDHGRQRQAKMFSLFSVVNFLNSPCATTESLPGSSGNRNGTCFSSTECSDKGGDAEGSCASGFGVCCLFIVKSSETFSENCTYVQNPNFPAVETSTNSITYTVNKCADGVCSLRLDFESFSIQGAGATNVNDEGVCLDTFTITTTPSAPVPVICGENTGQHMYVDIGAASGDSATLTFAFSGTANNRLWDIKVSQIECRNSNAPPGGCLQYFVGTSGRITTFNFTPTGDNHPNNLQYTACVRPEVGYCCVEYVVCFDQTTSNGFSLDASIATSLVDDDCLTSDFITIQGGTAQCLGDGTGGTASRFCGQFLNFVTGRTVNGPICDCQAPFQVDVFTNAFADGFAAAGNPNANPSRGVCLDYRQIPC